MTRPGTGTAGPPAGRRRESIPAMCDGGSAGQGTVRPTGGGRAASGGGGLTPWETGRQRAQERRRLPPPPKPPGGNFGGRLWTRVRTTGWQSRGGNAGRNSAAAHERSVGQVCPQAAALERSSRLDRVRVPRAKSPGRIARANRGGAHERDRPEGGTRNDWTPAGAACAIARRARDTV